MADNAENRDKEQGKEQKPQAQISFFVRNEAAHQATKRRKVIDRNNEEHEAVTVSWNWRDTWQNEHKRAFVVAKMAKADMLTEVHDSLQKALDEGVPFEQWKKEIVPKLEGKWLGKSVGQLWDELSEEEKAKRTPPSEKEREKVIGSERLELVFRTNMAVANAAGHYEQLMKTKAIYPYWRYVTRDDARVRDAHRALHNKVFKWDDPFWETYFPPNGFRCRCHVSPLTKRQVERDPKLHIEQSNIAEDADGRKVLDVGGSYYKNNPGWDYNPGDSISHLVSLAKDNKKGRPAQVQADLEADLAKKEAEEAAAAKAKAETEEQRKAEEARRAEAERQAKEAVTKAEAERQAKEDAAKAEAERQAKEAAAKAEAERQAKEAAAKAEAERQAKEAAAKAEAERQAKEAAAKAEAERQAKEAAAKAEAERQAKEAAAKAEAERQAKEAAAKAEAERLKTEKNAKNKEHQTRKDVISTVQKEAQNTKESASISQLPTASDLFTKWFGRKPRTSVSRPTNDDYEALSDEEKLNRLDAAKNLVNCINSDHFSEKTAGDDLQSKITTCKEVVLDLASCIPVQETRLLESALTTPYLKHTFNHNTDESAFYHNKGIVTDLWTYHTEQYCGRDYPIDPFTFAHETMHAIDWLAGRILAGNNGVKDSNVIKPLTARTNDNIYQTISAAAEADIVAFINEALMVRNDRITITKVDDIKYNIKRIRKAYHAHLNHRFIFPEEQVAVQAFTDLVGMYTKGSLLPPKQTIWDKVRFRDNHYFAHETHIYADQGVEGGNSELLAGMFATYFRGDIAMIENMESVLKNTKKIYPDIINMLYNIVVGSSYASRLNIAEYAEEELMTEEEKTRYQELKKELEEVRKRNAERAAQIDWDGLVRKKEEEYSRVIKASKKYVCAGLGEPMPLGYWRTWPSEAQAYPGGPVAVYEEAIRRGVTWKEVCGYKERRWGVDYID